MTLGDLLRIAIRGYRVILAALIVGVLIAIVVLALQPPSYRATAVVHVKAGMPAEASTEALKEAVRYANFRTITYKALATTGLVLDPVIDELGLSQSIDELADHVTVLSALDTTVLEIIVSWPTARGAADVANSIARHTIGELAEHNGAVTIELVQVSEASAAKAPAVPNPALSIGLAVFTALWLSLGWLVVRDRLVSRRIKSLDSA